MEKNFICAADFADFFHWLDHSNFVVHSHDRHKDSIRADFSLEHLQIDQPVCLHGEIGDVKTFVLKYTARVQHALVFGCCRDDVLFLRGVEPGHSLDGHVVALSSTRREDDLLSVSTNHLTHMSARRFHRFLYLPTIVMRARVGIAILPRHEWHHRIEHAWIHGGGALVVQKGRAAFHKLALDVKYHIRVVRRDLQPPPLLMCANGRRCCTPAAS
mmetsp:Transcript_35033/g.51325  ORF Transcript_35033/g.51325 Transcript_35033/m.51325 type:complete len:215 (-) Transcript_35033:94-738(-)